VSDVFFFILLFHFFLWCCCCFFFVYLYVLFMWTFFFRRIPISYCIEHNYIIVCILSVQKCFSFLLLLLSNSIILSLCLSPIFVIHLSAKHTHLIIIYVFMFFLVFVFELIHETREWKYSTVDEYGNIYIFREFAL
jgi:hypothetical protein